LPSGLPSVAGSSIPTSEHSVLPTFTGSSAPSAAPSEAPSGSPSDAPSGSPSSSPSNVPSEFPSGSPSGAPSGSPSANPSNVPTEFSSGSPSDGPSGSPSASLSNVPTEFLSSSPSDAPSGVPSSSPSDVPSEAPTGTPTDFPTGSPTGQPTDGAEADSENCPEEVVLVNSAGSRTFDSLPIDILSSTTSEVTFSVSQTWVDGPLCYVATQYTAASTSIETCSREDNVRPGEFASYTASCGDDGYAAVDIHVYDASFSAVTDVATIPDLCSPIVNSGRTVSYTFQLLCVQDSDPCVDREKQVCSDVTDGVLVEEDYESRQALDWIFGSEESSNSFSKFLGRLGGNRPEVVRTFNVPTDADLISLEFNLYEIDNWQPDDKLFVRLDDSYMDLGHFENDEGTSSGYFGDIAFSIESSPAMGNLGFNTEYQDQTHKINLTIPKSWYTTGRLTIGFKVVTAKCLECASAGIDNVKITVICDAPTGSPSLAPIIEPRCEDGNDIAVSYEDFETPGETDTWIGGLESYGFDSTFLGRFSQENPRASKVFTIPTAASSIDLSFDWYNIDGFDSSIDTFFVEIQDTTQELQLVGLSGEAYNDGIAFSYQQDADRIYRVKANIPRSHYTNGELLIGFSVETSTVTKSVGIDNVSIIGLCPKDRYLKGVRVRNIGTEDTESLSQSDWDGDDQVDDYCSKNDFPCEGESHVYVCHYSTRGGYNTFCIPEKDAEVIRFYSHDYCGPCVGGYGGIGGISDSRLEA